MLFPLLALCLTATPHNLEAERLTLDDAIGIAYRLTAGMIRARADVLLVDVERARAVGAILPTLNLAVPVGYNLSRNTIVEARSPITTDFVEFGVDEKLGTFGEAFLRPSLSLRQTVVDGGRWWTTIGRVGDIEAQRKAALLAMTNNVRLNVVVRFYNLERANQSLEAVRRQLELSRQQLARAKARAREGGSKATDVAIAQRNVAQDRVNLARRQFSADEAVRNLNIAMGRSPALPVQIIVPETIRTATGSAPAPEVPPVSRLVDSALRVRPELIGSRAALQISEKNIALRKAALYPRVTVGATYRKGWGGAGSRRPDRIFGDPSQNMHVAFDATITWNLFNGLRDEAGIQEGELNLTKSIANYDNLERSVTREVHSRAQNLTVQIEVYKLAQDALTSAEEAVRLARGQFTEAKGTALEVRDAELRFTQARLSAINARIDVEIAREQLRRAIGEDF